MSKKSIIVISLLILLIIFLNAFSASYMLRNMTNLAYVLALGIDVGENAKMKISAQFTKTAVFSSNSGTSGEDESNIVLVSEEADSIFSGINLLNNYIGKEINLSHCNIIVFSEEFAKKGISSEIYSLINNEEMRVTTNVLVSTCDAYDYLNNIKPNLEKLTVQYYDTFSITNNFTGYFPNVTIGDFYNSLSSDYSSCTAILVGLDATARQKLSEDSSSSQSSNQEPQDVITNPEELIAGKSSIESKRGSENIGMAVFDKDSFLGVLTATETMCHMILQKKLDSCIVSIDNPVNNDKIELQATPNKKPKITVNLEDNIPKIKIDISIDADILTLEENINYESAETLEQFSQSAENYFKDQIEKYLNKITNEYHADIDNFFTKALSHFATIEEWQKYNWNEKFKNAEFDVSVDVNVITSLLLTKT